jgi:hypothetical protein
MQCQSDRYESIIGRVRQTLLDFEAGPLAGAG